MAPIQHIAGADGPPPAPRVPDGRRVYAIGDVHGRRDLLARLHRMIEADARGRTPDSPVVVYLGDYVDRGPDSFAVLDSLIKQPLPGVARVFLKGNHEDMLLDFLAGGARSETWLLNGGVATLASYGIDLPLFAGDAEVAAARRAFRQAVAGPHLDFLKGLELFRRIGDYLFVHAGLRPGRPLEEQEPADLLWIRRAFLDAPVAGPYVVVHGHTIAPEPEVADGRIGIDTGAYGSGRLTCLVLEGAQRRFLHT